MKERRHLERLHERIILNVLKCFLKKKNEKFETHSYGSNYGADYFEQGSER